MSHKKPLRIEVVGSHSVGKSVLVRHIAAAYDLPILDEIARIEIAKMGGDSFDRLRADLGAVTRFQRNVFQAQLRAGAGVPRYVSDRAFDNIAYAAENAAHGTAAAMWRSAACRRYVRGPGCLSVWPGSRSVCACGAMLSQPKIAEETEEKLGDVARIVDVSSPRKASELLTNVYRSVLRKRGESLNERQVAAIYRGMTKKWPTKAEMQEARRRVLSDGQ